MLRKAIIYMRNGYRVVLTDRIILFIDIFIATGLIFLMQFMLWQHIYQDPNNSNISDQTLNEMLMYYFFVISLSRFNNGYSVIEDISYDIYSGRVELAVIKPLSFKLQKLFEYLGGSVIYLPLALLPITTHIFFLSSEINFSSILLISSYILLLVLSQVLCFLIAFIIAMITVKTENTEFILVLYSTLATFLGGVLLPPSYWPESMLFIMEYNPFTYTMATIANYTLDPTLRKFIDCFVGILIYTILFNCISNIAWKKSMKKYKGLGG